MLIETKRLSLCRNGSFDYTKSKSIRTVAGSVRLVLLDSTRTVCRPPIGHEDAVVELLSVLTAINVQDAENKNNAEDSCKVMKLVF